jgi:hypothetical protein
MLTAVKKDSLILAEHLGRFVETTANKEDRLPTQVGQKKHSISVEYAPTRPVIKDSNFADNATGNRIVPSRASPHFSSPSPCKAASATIARRVLHRDVHSAVVVVGDRRNHQVPDLRSEEHDRIRKGDSRPGGCSTSETR